MNSRNKRKLAYKAKNLKAATVRNLTLANNIHKDYNNVEYNNKQKDYNNALAKKMRLSNMFKLNKQSVTDLIKQLANGTCTVEKDRHSHMTTKYACGVQKLRKARKSA